MKTVIEMAKEAGLLTIGTADGSEAVYTWPKGITEELERFANLIISHKLDEIADKLQQDFKGAFGADTCASWASWIRGQK